MIHLRFHDLIPPPPPGYDSGVVALIDQWLSAFRLDDHLHTHAAHVIGELPKAVRDDLMNDPGFVICDYEPGPSAVMRVPMGVPRFGSGGSRSVVLKRTLRRARRPFVRWLIAHELAHAYLRNEGRWDGDDPEAAADALAAEWGFPRPPAREAWASLIAR